MELLSGQKKLRSAEARNTLDLLAATADIQPFDATALGNADAVIVTALTKGEIPAATPAKFDDGVQAALELAMDSSKPEGEVTAALVEGAGRNAGRIAHCGEGRGDRLLTTPSSRSSKASDKFDEKLMPGDKTVFRNFSAARLRYTAARYDGEARLNQSIASIYELRCARETCPPRSTTSAAGNFFFGMLAAQMAVIISTFAIAARQENFLWSIAAAAGRAAAVSFSVYVYLYV